MIELLEGFWVDPFSVAVIKAIDESSCSLWVTGQSAMDGFVLSYPAQEVVDAVLDARADMEDGDSSSLGDEEDNDEEKE